MTVPVSCARINTGNVACIALNMHHVHWWPTLQCCVLYMRLCTQTLYCHNVHSPFQSILVSVNYYYPCLVKLNNYYYTIKNVDFFYET